MLWINLTQDERNILEHLDGIHSGQPQLLEIEADKPVIINGTVRTDLPVPSDRNFNRMASCMRRNVDKMEIFEETPQRIRVKPLPFDKRAICA
jgi:hypothetical protein|tara:strand:+ start:322 stop:600 length:279 start_codon:yes stop_codon:yes gene_type:complete